MSAPFETQHSPAPSAGLPGASSGLVQAASHRFGHLAFGARFARLPAEFYTRVEPTPLPDPHVVAVSSDAAALIGLSQADLSHPAFASTFSGNQLPPSAEPLAAVYSGHQFGVWAGQLGDGRAILIGDLAQAGTADGARLEVQLKGSGPTPYSRRADGRAVLRSSIREYLCSEAMFALGIPTTRALAVIGSPARVRRETIESAAVVTRLAPSFIRFGSFEHWYAAGRVDALRTLADAVIDDFYPATRAAQQPYAALLREVTRRTAQLMAQWQGVGFCHGVMNTDNMSILGLTLDYGPFGFLDAFDAKHICNHSDDQGRYAYDRQPAVAHWNLYCLGQALLPLIGEVDETKAILDNFSDDFSQAMGQVMRAKLGLASELPDDKDLVADMWTLLHAQRVDFTLFFRRLGNLRSDGTCAGDAPRDLFMDRATCDAWCERYRTRLAQDTGGRSDDARRAAMNLTNPKFILRNHLAEQAIRQAQQGDFSEVTRLHEILRQPFDEQPEHATYADLPPDWAAAISVSCSS